MEMGSQTAAAAEKPGDESPWLSRPQPHSLKDLGVPEILLANLTLKHCFYLEVCVRGDLVERLTCPPKLIHRLS